MQQKFSLKMWSVVVVVAVVVFAVVVVDAVAVVVVAFVVVDAGQKFTKPPSRIFRLVLIEFLICLKI